MTKPTSGVDHQHQHLYPGQTEQVHRETFLFSANVDFHEPTMHLLAEQMLTKELRLAVAYRLHSAMNY